jgi:hypothetical protein
LRIGFSQLVDKVLREGVKWLFYRFFVAFTVDIEPIFMVVCRQFNKEM